MPVYSSGWPFRAQYDGSTVRTLPLFVTPHHVHHIHIYANKVHHTLEVLPNSRAIICNAPDRDSVREVVNPGKVQKLEEVVSRHEVDPVVFKRVGRRLRRGWPLLP